MTLKTLQAKRLIVGERPRKSFEAIFGSASIKNLLQEHGCCVANISQKFGIRVTHCGVCDFCRKKAQESGQTQVVERVRRQDIETSMAEECIQLLIVQCVVCMDATCNGEKCLDYGSCFNCGSTNHRRSNCPVSVSRVLKNKACLACFEPFNRPGYVPHGPRDCPLQRCLKRLIFHVHKRTRPAASLEETLLELTCDIPSYNSFLCANVNSRK